MNEDEKNALLAEQVMGWVRNGKYWVQQSEDTCGGAYTIEAYADYDIPQWAPHIDTAAALSLVRALPEERRRDFIGALRQELFAAHGGWPHWADEMFALLTATPRQLRDAVLAAMEGT